MGLRKRGVERSNAAYKQHVKNLGREHMRTSINSRYRSRLDKLASAVNEKNSKVSDLGQYEIDSSGWTDEDKKLIRACWRLNIAGHEIPCEMQAALDNLKSRSIQVAR